MAATGHNTSLLSLPTETLASIYVHCQDIRDAQALSGTCRSLREIFAMQGNHIAQSYAFRLLGPSDYKLGVMAVASRAIDPRDREEVERFLKAYVHQRGAWPVSNFTTSLMAALPRLVRAADALADYASHWFVQASSDISPTEHARKVRSSYMGEIAANLFYRVPVSDESGGGEAFRWGAPFPDLEREYWMAFSSGEIWQAYEMRNPLTSLLFEVEWRIFDHENYKDCDDPVLCEDERELWYRRYVTCAFNCLAGIENLYSWLEEFHDVERYGEFRPCHIQESGPENGCDGDDRRKLTIKVKGAWQHGLAHPLAEQLRRFSTLPMPQDGLSWPRPLYAAALETIDETRPPRPRFQPDPESISDEMRVWVVRSLSDIHRSWHADMWKIPRALSDAATWSTMVERFREPAPSRFDERGDPNLERYQLGFQREPPKF